MNTTTHEPFERTGNAMLARTNGAPDALIFGMGVAIWRNERSESRASGWTQPDSHTMLLCTNRS